MAQAPSHSVSSSVSALFPSAISFSSSASQRSSHSHSHSHSHSGSSSFHSPIRIRSMFSPVLLLFLLFSLLFLSFVSSVSSSSLNLAFVVYTIGQYNVAPTPIHLNYSSSLADIAGYSQYPLVPWSIHAFYTIDYYVTRVNQLGGIPQPHSAPIPMTYSLFFINANCSESYLAAQENSIAYSIANCDYGCHQFVLAIRPQNRSIYAGACSETNNCIYIEAGVPADSLFICGANDQSRSVPSLGPPPDESFCQNQPSGSRRFTNLISILPPADYFMETQLALWKGQGVQRIAIIWSNREENRSMRRGTLSTMLDYRMEVTIDRQMPEFGLSTDAADAFVKEMIDRDVEALIFIALAAQDSDLPIYFTGLSILKQMKARSWIPKAMNFACSYLPFYPTELTEYISQVPVWNYALKGSNFRCKNSTASSLELFPADSRRGLDTPQVLREALLASPKIGPIWSEPLSVITALMTQWCYVTHKLVEKAGSTSLDAIRAAIMTVSTPSPLGLLQFDGFGRQVLSQRDQTVYQQRSRMVNGMTEIFNYFNAPYSIAQPLIFPMPTWDERVYSQKSYDTPLERGILAVNCVLLIIPLILALITVRYKSVTPILPATPLFLFFFCFGAFVFLLAVTFFSLDPTDTTCRWSIWLFSLGFTLMYGSLFLKTARIAIIMHQNRLHMKKITTQHLSVALFMLLLVDVIINCIWEGTVGIDTELQVPDPLRPSQNFHTCIAGPENRSYLYAALAWKGLLICAGMVTTFLAKDVEKQFNESSYLAASIYVITFISFLLSPLIGFAGVTKENVYLLLSLGTDIAVLTVLALIFGPKVYSLYLKFGLSDIDSLEGNAMKYTATDQKGGNGASNGKMVQKQCGWMGESGGSSTYQLEFSMVSDWILRNWAALNPAQKDGLRSIMGIDRKNQNQQDAMIGIGVPNQQPQRNTADIVNTVKENNSSSSGTLPAPSPDQPPTTNTISN